MLLWQSVLVALNNEGPWKENGYHVTMTTRHLRLVCGSWNKQFAYDEPNTNQPSQKDFFLIDFGWLAGWFWVFCFNYFFFRFGLFNLPNRIVKEVLA